MMTDAKRNSWLLISGSGVRNPDGAQVRGVYREKLYTPLYTQGLFGGRRIRP